jgi:hypothetical protein
MHGSSPVACRHQRCPLKHCSSIKHKNDIVIFFSVDQQARALNGATCLPQVWGGAAKLGVVRSVRHTQDHCQACQVDTPSIKQLYVDLGHVQMSEASRLICEPRTSQTVILHAFIRCHQWVV